MEATHYLPKKNDKNIIQLYYCLVDGNRWNYLSTCGGGWFNSSYTLEEGFEKLIKLEN